MPTKWDAERVERSKYVQEVVASMNLDKEAANKEAERLFLELQNAKADEGLAFFKAGGSRIEAIDMMPDRSWGAPVPPQWELLLGDRDAKISDEMCDQFAKPIYGYNLSLTRAASETCNLEGGLGAVMFWFDHDIFLSIAQDTVDGRNDANLLRFDRAAVEAAVADFNLSPTEWFKEEHGFQFPPTLVLPYEYEGIPSQKKYERSLGWHLVAYENLIERHGPLVAATFLTEDYRYEIGYGASGHPIYGYADPTNGNEVIFDPFHRGACSKPLLKPTDGTTLDWADLNEDNHRGCRVLMEVLFKTYSELFEDFKSRENLCQDPKYRSPFGFPGFMLRGEADHFKTIGKAGALSPRLSKSRVDLRHFHSTLRQLVLRERARLGRSTRSTPRQPLYDFVYRECPNDVFQKVVEHAVPKPTAPPKLGSEPNLTGGRETDGGGCAIM